MTAPSDAAVRAAGSRRAGKVRVLVVGQTPPPVHGQALAIERILAGRYERVELFHVRMGFSTQGSDVGRFQWRKIARLAGLVIRIVWARFRHRANLLYYPPAGPTMVPMCRDLAILLLTRPFFRRTVFHFHGGGLSELHARLGRVSRWVFRRAYGRPAMAIRTSRLTPEDGACVGARQEAIVPYGVADEYPRFRAMPREAAGPAVILYVGTLMEAKGVRVLLDACQSLAEAGRVFRLRLVGGWESPVFEREMRDRISRSGMAERVEMPGILTGDAKWRAFRDADIFCFPSHYECEAQPQVVLEAMQFQLPVVSTRWRAIPDMVDEGQTGFLVPPRDADALKDRLARLLDDPHLGRRLGSRGREVYLTRFTVDRFRSAVEQALVQAADGE